MRQVAGVVYFLLSVGLLPRAPWSPLPPLQCARYLDIVRRDLDQGIERALQIRIHDVGDHGRLVSDPPNRIRSALDEQ